MPRAFDQSERDAITERLKEAARRLFAAQGVVKTAVEDLTRAAGIAKGSFYAFYPNKELLFFELLEESQNRIRQPLVSARTGQGDADRERLAELVHDVLDAMLDDPFMRVLGQKRELDAVMRRVPAGYLKKHQHDDRAFIEEFIDRWNTTAERPAADEVAARVTMLVLLSLQRDFFGDRLFPHARDAVVAGLCDCFFPDSQAVAGTPAGADDGASASPACLPASSK